MVLSEKNTWEIGIWIKFFEAEKIVLDILMDFHNLKTTMPHSTEYAFDGFVYHPVSLVHNVWLKLSVLSSMVSKVKLILRDLNAFNASRTLT